MRMTVGLFARSLTPEGYACRLRLTDSDRFPDGEAAISPADRIYFSGFRIHPGQRRLNPAS
jgi:hypothetical protein